MCTLPLMIFGILLCFQHSSPLFVLELLMPTRNEKQQKQRDLEEEVGKLQAELDQEHRLGKVLKYALHEPIHSRQRLPSWIPLQVQMLLAEITMVEQEIIWLERKHEELKLCLSREEKQTKQLRTLQQQKKHRHCRSGNRRKHQNLEILGLSFNSVDSRSQRWDRERNMSLHSASDSAELNDKVVERSNSDQIRQRVIGDETSVVDPNRLSKDLISCLISIFLKLNRPSSQFSATVYKLGLSCISSKGLASKTSFNCKAPTVLSDSNKTFLDPYGIMPNIDGTVRDVGPYKNFMQMTRSSLDMSRLPECFLAFGKLRVLMHKLSTLNLSMLTYNQKLAFWINIYNACIMHAYLHHGLPSTVDRQLSMMNKAALNVGGIVLNALAIEHFILRHPSDSKNGGMDEKERLLWHAHGLGYPEPNVMFALCRGSWSSPALRIYTAEDVVNELVKAKTEYLEASVGVTSKKKILVPKLLYWHMRDFADNMESLLEWIYSQLPRAGAVKQLIIECLNAEIRTPLTKMVEVQSYESEFRYILPQ